MQVRVESWRGGKETMSLEGALAPSVGYDDSGSLERARALAQGTADAMGRLLAMLVEKRMLTVAEAYNAAGHYGAIELVE